MEMYSSNMDLQSTLGFDNYPYLQVDFPQGEIEGKFRLKPPKRTMSAYSCYSRSVYLIVISLT